jgi:uncharacterized membrane protein (DUF373 family)
MNRFLKGFERAIVLALIGLMMVLVLAATIELIVLIVGKLASPPILRVSVGELLDMFGFFLLILIGLELLETIKAYLSEHVVHVEIVLEVALIAIARKVIILDVKKTESLSLLGIALLIASLAGAYYLERKGRKRAAELAQ